MKEGEPELGGLRVSHRDVNLSMPVFGSQPETHATPQNPQPMQSAQPANQLSPQQQFTSQPPQFQFQARPHFSTQSVPTASGTGDIILGSTPPRKSKKSLILFLFLVITILSIGAYMLLNYIDKNSISSEDCALAFNQLSNYAIDGKNNNSPLDGQFSKYHVNTYEIFKINNNEFEAKKNYANVLNEMAENFYFIAQKAKINQLLKTNLEEYALTIISYIDYNSFYYDIDQLTDGRQDVQNIDQYISEKYGILLQSKNEFFSGIGKKLTEAGKYRYLYVKTLIENNCLISEPATKECRKLINSDDVVENLDKINDLLDEIYPLIYSNTTDTLSNSWNYSKELNNEKE